MQTLKSLTVAIIAAVGLNSFAHACSKTEPSGALAKTLVDLGVISKADGARADCIHEGLGNPLDKVGQGALLYLLGK